MADNSKRVILYDEPTRVHQLLHMTATNVLSTFIGISTNTVRHIYLTDKNAHSVNLNHILTLNWLNFFRNLYLFIFVVFICLQQNAVITLLEHFLSCPGRG